MDSYDELYKIFLKINVLYGSYQEINENIKKNQLYHFNDFKIRNEIISEIKSFEEDLKNSEFNRKIDINPDTKTLEFKNLCLNELDLDYLDLTYFDIIRFEKVKLKKNSNNLGGNLILKEKNINEICFENCIAENEILLNSIDECKELAISKLNKINKFSIINSKIMNIDISLDNNRINKLEIVEFSNIQNFFTNNHKNIGYNYIKSIEIVVSNFGRFELENLSLGEINIVNSFFDKEIYFLNLNSYQSISENVLPSINIQNSILKERFKISTSKSKEYSKRKKNDISSLYLLGNTFYKDIRLGHSNINLLKIENLKILENNELNIGEVNVQNLEFHAIRNNGSIRIYNLNKNYKENNISPKKYVFSNNNFGNLELQSIDFQSFEKAVMFENLVQNCLFSDVYWSEEILGDEKSLFESYDEESTNKYLIQQENTYRLLKNVAKSNNNKAEELNFYSKEMKVYFDRMNDRKNDKLLKSLELRIKSLNMNFLKDNNSFQKIIGLIKPFAVIITLIIYVYRSFRLIFEIIKLIFLTPLNYIYGRNDKISTKSEIITLEFSSINDFGINWIKPTIITLSLNLVFLFIYFSLTQEILQEFSVFHTYDNFLDFLMYLPILINQIFLLLNPLNTFAFVIDKENIHPIWEVFRNLLSIINAILIYQIIVAFRKFSKK